MKNTIITSVLIVTITVLTSFSFRDEPSPSMKVRSQRNNLKIENAKMDLVGNISLGGNKKND